MSDAAARLQQLSPEQKRELLAKLLRENASQPRRCPASFAQERLWFMEQFAPGNPFFNIATAVRVHTPFHPVLVERSLNEIVRRHESLRTTFAGLDGQPVQVIAPFLSVPVPVIDLSALPDAERQAEAVRLATEEAQRPFDLAQGPLLRATLLRLGGADYVFLLTMHHIISDGWSIGVFFQELNDIYTAYLAGRPSPLPELPVQYADYAAWQREWLQGDVLEAQLAYWKRKLADLPMLQLPTDRPRPLVPTHHGSHHAVTINGPLTARLRELSNREGVTLFMTLLAAFKALLQRYTGQDDLVVGTYIANRNRAEVERLIGFFINTLVMRTDASGDPTFREFLGRVRETAMGAYPHQDMPFTTLVEALKPERDLSRNPLFQVVFQLFTTSTAAHATASAPGTTTQPLQLQWRRAAAFDLVFSLAETPNGLAGGIEYSTDLFDGETIARLAGHFEVLLSGIVTNPDEHLSRLPLLTAAERRQLLVEWNDTARDYALGGDLLSLFQAVVAEAREATAFVCNGESLTYGELNRRANQLAHYLRSIGVGHESLVGVCHERSLDAVVGLLGIFKAGGAYLPLDPSYPPQRLAFMLEDTGAAVLLTRTGIPETLGSPNIAVVLLDRACAEIERQSDLDPAPNADSGSLAYVIYTSGSTGRPKGVAVEHAQILNRLHWMWEAYPFEPREVSCHKTALNFVDSMWELLGPLLKGVPTVIASDQDVRAPAALVSLLAEHRVTRIWLVPSLLRALLETYTDLQHRLPALRFWVSSGEALSGELLQQFRNTMPHAVLYNLYGTSEIWDATCYDTTNESGPLWRVPIGHPIANVQAYVLDANREPVPAGVPGELYVGGRGLARGYVNLPALTREKFVPHPFSDLPGARLYRTGDLVRYRRDGALEYIERIDRQVKIRGYRVETDEVEGLLNQCPGIQEAVVVAREATPGDLRLVAYVVPANGDTPDPDGWRRFVRGQLPEYMVPSAFLDLKSMPLTPSGKVDRLALQAETGIGHAEDVPFVAPRNPAEVTLAALFAEVLSVQRVGIHNDFFAELGGHSLLATRLISRVRDRFKLEVPLRRFFETPTVAGLAEAVAQGADGSLPRDRAIQRVPRQLQQVRISATGVLETATEPGSPPAG